MKERLVRLKQIKKIIKDHKIESQDELLKLLKKDGVSITQATLSRDLKILKVSKAPDGKQGYYYALPGEIELRESIQSCITDFMRGYISIDYSSNLAVIKTQVGHCDPVALAIENLGFEDVLGTISGETTVFVALRDGYTGEMFLRDLKAIITDIDE